MTSNDQDVRDDASVGHIFRSARQRIDGAAMYISIIAFCVIGVLSFAFPTVLKAKVGLYGLGVSAILMIPVVFFLYLSLAYFSAHGKVSRIKNAVILLAVTVYFCYRVFAR